MSSNPMPSTPAGPGLKWELVPVVRNGQTFSRWTQVRDGASSAGAANSSAMAGVVPEYDDEDDEDPFDDWDEREDEALEETTDAYTNHLLDDALQSAEGLMDQYGNPIRPNARAEDFDIDYENVDNGDARDFVTGIVEGDDEELREALAKFVEIHPWDDLGSNFYLSSAGHGAGFFDAPTSDRVGLTQDHLDKLQEHARTYSPPHVEPEAVFRNVCDVAGRREAQEYFYENSGYDSIELSHDTESEYPGVAEALASHNVSAGARVYEPQKGDIPGESFNGRSAFGDHLYTPMQISMTNDRGQTVKFSYSVGSAINPRDISAASVVDSIISDSYYSHITDVDEYAEELGIDLETPGARADTIWNMQKNRNNQAALDELFYDGNPVNDLH